MNSRKSEGPNIRMINQKPPFRMNARIQGLVGINMKSLLNAVKGFVTYFVDIFRYWRESKKIDGALPIYIKNLYPITYDRYMAAGSARGHYFFQDLWMARQIFKRNPRRHVDIGSRIDGFISHLLVFREVEVVDVRYLESTVPELTFHKDDATSLRSYADESLPSVSSLHAIEHFGLGRYGDPIAPRAHLDFMVSLQRVLEPGGYLYLGVPIGRERVEFNAHRILSPHTITNAFSELDLVDFAAIGDDGLLYEEKNPEDFENAHFSCGLFIFQKPK